MRLRKYLAISVCALLLLTSCSAKQEKEKTSSTKDVTPSLAEISTQSSIEAASSVQPDKSVPESVSNAYDGGSGGSDAGKTVGKKIESPECRSAVLYCVDDGRTLYDDGSDIRTAPASITKLLTASVMLKYMDTDDVVTVGSEQSLVHEDSSVCFISQGNRLKVKDLLTGMLLSSGNDAAYTAAVSTARAVRPDEELSDEEAVAVFCGLMNELAAEIGMKDSHFTTPDGWDDENQRVTAADLVKLSEYALKQQTIREIVGTHQKYVVFESGENITWINTNSLLDPESRFYSEYAIGLKTGTTDDAGCCLAAAFSKDGKIYITVVTGCGESDDRFDLTQKLFSLTE